MHSSHSYAFQNQVADMIATHLFHYYNVYEAKDLARLHPETVSDIAHVLNLGDVLSYKFRVDAYEKQRSEVAKEVARGNRSASST